MKGFIFGVVSILLTVFIYEGVTTLIDLKYNLFGDKFNLASLLVDMGLFIAIFMLIYFVAKKVIFNKDN